VLQIANRRERTAVAAADAVLRLARVAGRGRSRPAAGEIRRILVLRLERIGDLLMSLPALHALHQRAPQARIEHVVGSWNETLARQVDGIDAVETMDAPWLARGAGGAGWPALLRQARSWRARQYDLAINLEGDIRSNILLHRAGGRWRAGFGMAGGGPLLDDNVLFDPRSHAAVNGVRLVRTACGELPGPHAWPVEGLDVAARLPRARLTIPEAAHAEADAMLRAVPGLTPSRLLIGLHVGAGRAVKEWPACRMAEVGAWAARERGAAIVLTGSPADRAAADEVCGALPGDTTIVDTVGRTGLLPLAAVLSRLSLFVTPDTGPMHLAATVGTAMVALFGPSSPDRWGPLSPGARILRVELPCSPCNRIRNPPARCLGHTPDCMDGIRTHDVIEAAAGLLQARPREHTHGAR
jgi:lipopolysaccharide heptosyltransferase II